MLVIASLKSMRVYCFPGEHKEWIVWRLLTHKLLSASQKKTSALNPSTNEDPTFVYIS